MSRVFIRAVGTSQVAISPSASINDLPQHTHCVWIKVASVVEPNTLPTVFSRGQTEYCNLDNFDAAQYTLVDVMGTSGDAALSYIDNTIAIETWIHVATTYDDTGDRIPHVFINGVEASYAFQQAGTGILDENGSTDFTIGHYAGLSDYDFDGNIFDFRLYNSILSETDIASIVALGPTKDPDPGHMVIQLTFATNQGDVEPDASGNGNTGAITDAAFSADNPSFIVATEDTVSIGEFGGNSLAEAFYNPSQMDLIHVLNEGGDVVWNLTYDGVASTNPVSPTKKALVGSYFGESFALAFPNPYSKNVFQVIGQGDNVVFWIDYQGNAYSI